MQEHSEFDLEGYVRERVPVSEELEANYICTVVNITTFNFAVQSYSQNGAKNHGMPSILGIARVPK
jgi:hypothetical protein